MFSDVWFSALSKLTQVSLRKANPADVLLHLLLLYVTAFYLILHTSYSKYKFNYLFWSPWGGLNTCGLDLVFVEKKKKRRVFPHIYNFSEGFQVIILVDTRTEGGNAMCRFPRKKTESI